jgi:hypothetical protein
VEPSPPAGRRITVRVVPTIGLAVVLTACGATSYDSAPADFTTVAPTHASEVAVTTPAPPTLEATTTTVRVAAAGGSLRDINTDESNIDAVALAERVHSETLPARAKTNVNVVERYGRTQSGGLVVPDSTGELLDDQTRFDIEQALAPFMVTWVESVDSVIGDTAPTVDEVGVIVWVSPPEISGTTATVGTALWCGNVCGHSGTYDMEWSFERGWRVTGTRNEFVA